MTRQEIYDQPDAEGFFGRFGGSFISETLAQAIEELHTAYRRYRDDPAFIAELEEELTDYVGRPSPVYYASRLSEETGGARIFLKREDLNHTGAHKINNVIGQASWRDAWGSSASSPRPAQASTALPPRRFVPATV